MFSKKPRDEELQCLRQEWLRLVAKRKVYLESEVQALSQQTSKYDKNEMPKY